MNLRMLALAGLVVAAAVLSGCVAYEHHDSPPPDYGWWAWGGAWAGAMAVFVLLLLVLVAVAAVVVVAIVVMALTGRGPASHVAGALLIGVGALVLLAGYPEALAALLGVGLIGVGALALQPARPAEVPAPGRAAVVEEARR